MNPDQSGGYWMRALRPAKLPTCLYLDLRLGLPIFTLTIAGPKLAPCPMVSPLHHHTYSICAGASETPAPAAAQGQPINNPRDILLAVDDYGTVSSLISGARR